MKKLLAIFIILTMLLAGCMAVPPQIAISAEDSLVVDFIDVGQGDCILCISPDGRTMLIDCGEAQYYDVVKSALKKRGVSRIDVLVGTHPHTDHIGCMSEIVENFDIGAVYMPKVTANTATYERLLKSIKGSGMNINAAKSGDVIDFAKDILVEVLAPVGEYGSDLNEWSIVIKLEYAENSFLFTGDAGYESEEDVISAGEDVAADVLKVGHHGSRYSSSPEFLDAVGAEIGIVMCGKGNDYGHPHKEFLDRADKNALPLLRTDEEGTITAIADGKQIVFYNEEGRELILEKTDSASYQVSEFIGNKNSRIYHSPDCSGLPLEKNRVYFDSIDEAEKAGYRADKRCVE